MFGKAILRVGCFIDLAKRIRAERMSRNLGTVKLNREMMMMMSSTQILVYKKHASSMVESGVFYEVRTIKGDLKIGDEIRPTSTTIGTKTFQVRRINYFNKDMPNLPSGYYGGVVLIPNDLPEPLPIEFEVM